MSSLRRVKVFLLEDDYLINVATADLLEQEFGCQVTAVFNLDEAQQVLQRQSPQIAVLDVNISGQLSFPVAELLHQRNIPIVFVTGYDVHALGGRWARYPVCTKPCNADQLKHHLLAALASPGTSGKPP